jgi:hypothetical protein
MNSKTPKIISGISARILLIVAAFVVLSSFWFWVLFDIAAALLVAIGCGGEWYLHHHPAGRRKREKDEYHKMESRYIASVSVGVIMEVFCLAHSIREGIKLENETARLESTNLVLRSNIVVLETRIIRSGNRARMLVDAQQIFDSALKDKPAGEMIVWYIPNDKEAYMFARVISSISARNGWAVGIPHPIPTDWVSPHFRNIPRDASLLTNSPLAFRATSGLIGLSFFSTTSNAFVSVLTNAFIKSGFATVDWQPDNSLTTNQVKIVITENEQ